MLVCVDCRLGFEDLHKVQVDSWLKFIELAWIRRMKCVGYNIGLEKMCGMNFDYSVSTEALSDHATCECVVNLKVPKWPNLDNL